MKLEYVSHSCFVIHTKGLKIAFDPWISGSAYANQWHLFPQPVSIESVISADILLISHGHEDHLHHQSLQKIQKGSHVFFPFQWRKGVVSYLNHLGFTEITEAISFKTYDLHGIKITYLGYSLESVVVVECEGFVIVNINDALNSNHETATEFLLNKIKSKWPKIDFLLSGWSGAGYFPNKVHYKGKDDQEVAKIREQYFGNNFCKFTRHLQPRVSVPFSPGFVLLNKENRWINEIKFPRKMVATYYHENFEKDSQIQFPLTYPGDYFENTEPVKTSKYHLDQNENQMYEELDTLFKTEIAAADFINYLEEKEITSLIEKLHYWLARNATLYDEEVLKDAVFSLKFQDIEHNNTFNIAWKNGLFTIERGSFSWPMSRLIITTRAKLVSRNLDKIWGGDLLSIGYGIDVEVFEEHSLEKNLDIVCVRLISRYPRFKEDVVGNAGRVVNYYLRNPSLTNLWISQKIKLKPYVNKYPYNERDHWITYNKCELCKVCLMPELEFDKFVKP